MARGKLVVEEALVEALESGQLYAAAADVAAEEPLPPSSKLWRFAEHDPHAARRRSKLRGGSTT